MPAGDTARRDGYVPPCIPTRAYQAPVGPGWVHEIKHDGYLRDDNEIDAERCRISLREKSQVTLFTLDGAGRVVCLTGVVLSIHRAVGRRWRVEMDLATVARGRKTRQRAP
jgi:hypothetical protein